MNSQVSKHVCEDWCACRFRSGSFRLERAFVVISHVRRVLPEMVLVATEDIDAVAIDVVACNSS